MMETAIQRVKQLAKGRLASRKPSRAAVDTADLERPAFDGDRQYLFITGCSRSGTTALTTLVNKHPDVAVGYERFSKLSKENGLTPELYQAERFCEFRTGDTHHNGWAGDALREPVLHKIHAARLIGDKIPNLVERLEQLNGFPNARVIFIVREPYGIANSFVVRAQNSKDIWAADRSYEAAVKEFNSAMSCIEEFAASGERCLVLNYEEFFFDRVGEEQLWEFLDVDPATLTDCDDIFRASRASDKRGANAVAREVSMNADFDAYRRVSQMGQSHAGNVGNIRN
ncbi:sulfotransferase [Aliiroseovarius sp. S1339]|uniref:sulfotransferase family protein n=1 Tax=Aliiroseovarius sp. S1339 TaxID=2936990 RepID=UPI0020BDD757|nr:sulfotransferase [Aliiroseovarius sp. S1339]MCK8465554.1 sulfotransferase [Aliiroseovarius sp. S1339]